MTIDLIKLFLPDFLVDHFDFLRSEEKGGVLHLYFEEKNLPPLEFNSRILISKGFHQEITLQDFPLRGKQVFLHIKRRRWTDKTNNEIVQRDWNLVAKGSRLTQEFATFLKAISRF